MTSWWVPFKDDLRDLFSYIQVRGRSGATLMSPCTMAAMPAVRAEIGKKEKKKTQWSVWVAYQQNSKPWHARPKIYALLILQFYLHAALFFLSSLIACLLLISHTCDWILFFTFWCCSLLMSEVCRLLGMTSHQSWQIPITKSEKTWTLAWKSVYVPNGEFLWVHSDTLHYVHIVLTCANEYCPNVKIYSYSCQKRHLQTFL